MMSVRQREAALGYDPLHVGRDGAGLFPAQVAEEREDGEEHAVEVDPLLRHGRREVVSESIGEVVCDEYELDQHLAEIDLNAMKVK